MIRVRHVVVRKADQIKEPVQSLRTYCAEHGMYYYSRPAEEFSRTEAVSLALMLGHTKVLVHNQMECAA